MIRCNNTELDSRHAGIQSSSDREILKSFLEGNLLSDSPSRYLNPVCFSLGKFDWKVFGTLTFDRDFLTGMGDFAAKSREKEFDCLLTATAAKHDLRTRNLIYYGRSEFGRGERGHFNFLIGEFATENVSAAELAATMQTFWTTGNRRRGIAKIEPFRNDLKLEGIMYQSKYEFDGSGERLPICEVISPMLKKMICRDAARN